ncbi:MAG TPA: alpha/beta fold hydrolase [Trueperaceae bacterium]|nr:alpha/beta fold hydrolase [Trueperaceae bacterium]
MAERPDSHDQGKTMTGARLTLCGTPALVAAPGRPPLTSRKGLALLAYLALTGRTLARASLADLLWPDRERAEALSNLRRTLYRVRAALDPDAFDGDADSLGLRRETLWVDALAFRDALQAHPPHGEPSAASALALADAARLCGGALLDGFRLPGCPAFEEWLTLEREAHKQSLCRVLRHLAEAALNVGEHDAALRWAGRWAALDPLAEHAQRMAMRAQAQSGNAAAAIARYERWQTLLAQELGMPPAAETRALYRALRSGEPLPPRGGHVGAHEVRYARGSGVHIAYQVVGDGAVDLLVAPGFVSHLEHLWRSPPLRSVLTRLARKTRLVLFDRRGVGLSERLGAAPTLHATATDVDAVLDAIGSASAVLFGFSEGGPAALLYAALRPERVRGLVLYGTMARGLRAPDYPWALDEIQFDRWLDRLVSGWGKPVPHEAFAPSHAADAALWRWYGELLRLGSSPAGIRAILGALRDLDVRSLLPHVNTPTLLLQRRGDRVVRAGAGRFLAERLPGARYLELDGGDHWWWLGDSEAFLQAVEGFVEELASRPAEAAAIRTVLLLATPAGAGVTSDHADPLAALEATRHVGSAPGTAAGLRAAVHAGPREEDTAGLTGRLLAAARPGEVLVTDRVRDVACAVGYAFSPRRPAGGRSAAPALWALTARPA